MGQADFVYDMAGMESGAALAAAVYADGAAQRQAIGEDAAAAGLRLGEIGPVTMLTEGAAVRVLADVVVLDCPQADAATLAALARLDVRAARAGAQLVVSTTLDALDAVFGCLDQSRAQVLVDPTRGERVIALGRALAILPGMRVRELSQDDRLTLLRLTEQVSEIATRLDRLSGGLPRDGGAFRFESPTQGYRGEDESCERKLLRQPRPPLPDPRLVRRIIRQRRLRDRFFESALFADPAWDILLDLTAARAEHARVSVTSLCIASGVPPTTALRWIAQMVEAGLLVRVEDEADRRRAFIALSDRTADAMAHYFAELGKTAQKLV
ncbi:winged helix DNA-binding protein [Pelagerythrobacter sp.]|uniref:winged helix DNA-binding protein n=1 Tax=Pelagerythrobacter sp. TaxID=2800702 RepID=UPI0035AEF86E